MKRHTSPLASTLLAVALTGLAWGTGPAMAQQNDADQPVEVEADRLDLDDQAGTAIYTGEVHIQQGSMQLTGDRVELQRNAAGERAYIEQHPDPQEPVIRGWGRTIVYHVAERRVELIDRAELHQAGDTFDGGYLEYFLDRRVVQARAEAEGVEGRQRIRMTLQPER